MSGIVIFWCVLGGFVLGLIAESWARKLPQPPHTMHDSCHERCRKLQIEIRRKEEEIQRLVRGQA